MSVNNVSDPTVRQALELATSYSDDISGLVHPITEIDEGKAREIDRLAVLARKQITKATKSREPGVAEYVQLLHLTIRQFEGLALAFGRDKLQQGANLIESAVTDFEKLAKSQGSTETMPQSYHALGHIYLAMGKRDRAIKFFRHAVQASPNDIDYARALDEVENMPKGQRVLAATGKAAQKTYNAMLILRRLLSLGIFIGFAANIYMQNWPAVAAFVVLFIVLGAVLTAMDRVSPSTTQPARS